MALDPTSLDDSILEFLGERHLDRSEQERERLRSHLDLIVIGHQHPRHLGSQT